MHGPDAVSLTVGPIQPIPPACLYESSPLYHCVRAHPPLSAGNLNRQTKKRNWSVEKWKRRFITFSWKVKRSTRNESTYSCWKMSCVFLIWNLCSSTIFSKSFIRSSSMWSWAAKCELTKHTDTPYNLKRILTAPLLPWKRIDGVNLNRNEFEWIWYIPTCHPDQFECTPSPLHARAANAFAS